MEDFCKYLGINKTVSLICCMFWIFSAAEGDIITAVAGSKVILHCKNETNSKLTQLTWKMNKVHLFTFSPVRPLYESREAGSLKINISLSGSEMYGLVIERAQKSHRGNYTCDIITDKGPGEQKWELIITEHDESGNLNKLLIAVAVTVPCVCCLIFIVAFAILRRVCKRAGGRKKKIFTRTAWKLISNVAIIGQTITSPGLIDRKCSSIMANGAQEVDLKPLTS